MTPRDRQMEMFLRNFGDNKERLQKYMELLLLHDQEAAFNYVSREKLRRVCVVLTTKCNLNCVWCHRNEPRFADYLGREMPFEMLQKILPQLEGFTWLHYGGLGEPFFYPRLFEAIAEAKKYIPNVRTTTNATLLKREACQGLAGSGLTLLEVSIDGFAAGANKEARGVEEDRLISNMEYLSQVSDIDLQVNVVVSSLNYDSLFPAVDRLRNVANLKRIHAIPLFMTEHMVKLGIKEITQEQLKDLLAHWKERIKTLDLDLELWPDTFEATLDPVISLKRMHNLCFTVYDDPFINVDGMLSPCGRLQNLALDNAAEMGFDAAWNGPGITEWRQRQLRGDYAKECMLECHMKNTCRGGA